MSTREQWLLERRSLIGASDAPSILGKGYRTPAQVWAEKCGVVESEVDADVRLRIGTIIQPALVEIARAVFDLPAVAEPDNVIRRSGEVSYIGTSLDAVAGKDENGCDVPLELKNVDSFMAREWSDDAPHGCPIGFAVQVSQQMFVTGAKFGYVMGLIGGNKPVLRRIERNDAFITALIRKLAWFWNLVQTRTPPPYQDAKDHARTLAALYPTDNGSAIAMDDLALHIKQRRDDMDEALKIAQGERDECDNQLKALIGDNAFASLPDGRWLSWKLQHRKEFVTAATSFRVLRTHDRRPKDAPAITHEVAEPLEVEADRDVETQPDYVERSLDCQEALLSIGGIVRHESDSGSTYFVLPGGSHVRVADHRPNLKTAAWIERHSVTEIRIDQDDWRDQLEAITGPLVIEQE